MNAAKPISENKLQLLLDSLSGKDAFVFLETTKVSPENHRSYLFTDPLERMICNAQDDPADFFSRAQEKVGEGFYLAGYIGYELGYLLEPILAQTFKPKSASGRNGDALPLADLGVFKKPQIYDHLTGLLDGAELPAGDGSPQPTEFTVANLRLNLAREEYIEAISRIKSYIASGDTYQVNYTLKVLFDFLGSIPDFYQSLRRNQSVSYSGYIKNGSSSILTFSPELFFRKQGNIIDVRPMKGTMNRGRTIEEDREFAGYLQHDIKNRSENVMIVDLLRNDLGRLSRMGGVTVQSLFDVETYETLHQMTSSIRGELNRPISLAEMFRALFPCGSVTGAPKIRTMEIIRELESEDRGVYTGAVGFISPDGDTVFNVPIRTVVIRDRSGEMGIGSGIVWDSDPEGEWDECLLKGKFLTTPAPEFSLIETMLYHPEIKGYWLLDLHLARLAESARYFSYPLDLDDIKAALHREADNFSSTITSSAQRVRLTLAKSGEYQISHTELPGTALPEVDPGVVMQQAAGNVARVVFSDNPTDSQSPYLYHKTTMRRLYDEERARLVDGEEFYEVLFLNQKGEVTEGSYTNVFIQREGKLYTPPVSCGLLPGVLRRYLLQQYPGLVMEKILSRSDLADAEAVYVGNSVRGLVKVKIEN